MSRHHAFLLSALRAFSVVFAATSIGVAQPIPFQGLLTNNSDQPLDGVYDLEFSLYDAVSAGNPVGLALHVDDIAIVGGIVNTELDFGDEFWGADRWLEVGVRDGASGGAYEPIDPRTPILWSPRATTANRLGSLINLENLPSVGIDYRSPNDMRFHLDDDDNNSTEGLTVYDGAEHVLMRLQEGTGGDETVQLPASTISPEETIAEAGITNAFGSSTVSFTTGVQKTVATSTITLPVAGQIVAIASFRLNMAVGSGASFGIAQNSTTIPSDDVNAYSPDVSIDFPTSFVRVIPASAGAQTFNLIGLELAGNMAVNDPRLLLIFVPTSYGTVTTAGAAPAAGGDMGGLSSADIAADRTASIEANQRRIETELAAIKEQLDGLQPDSRKTTVGVK